MYQPCFPNGIWVFQFVLFFLIPKQRHSLLTIIYAIKKVHPFLNIPIVAQISLFFHSWRSSNFFCWVTHDPVWFHPFVEWSAHPGFHKTFLSLALKVVPPRKLLSPRPVRIVGQLLWWQSQPRITSFASKSLCNMFSMLHSFGTSRVYILSYVKGFTTSVNFNFLRRQHHIYESYMCIEASIPEFKYCWLYQVESLN